MSVSEMEAVLEMAKMTGAYTQAEYNAAKLVLARKKLTRQRTVLTKHKNQLMVKVAHNELTPKEWFEQYHKLGEQEKLLENAERLYKTEANRLLASRKLLLRWLSGFPG
jgi:K+ transporter